MISLYRYNSHTVYNKIQFRGLNTVIDIYKYHNKFENAIVTPKRNPSTVAAAPLSSPPFCTRQLALVLSL